MTKIIIDGNFEIEDKECRKQLEKLYNRIKKLEEQVKEIAFKLKELKGK
jgi:chaperonin cofactor prefoldin